ncbi:MAG: ImmA/IrrE family metallo-endopeptidase [Elusimicrobia bacterium]|nr:ImmA/IrrE family metallo-endopeptidase [Elusimicrobiota bacterium]
MMRVEVKPELLHWARERAGYSLAGLRKRFARLESWERGEAMPTLKQLEAFAKATFVPIGYLFLAEPPDERVPIPDLRTMGSEPLGPPSPDLLDVLYLCQRRQAWYRDYAKLIGEGPRRFAGSARIEDTVEQTADAMRRALNFDLEARRTCPTWTEALRRFIDQAEDLGILVMVSGVVGSNNRRKLDPEEFRGFALADDLAPLVFVNGADTRAAQMFTLSHELAHLWLGESALSDARPDSAPSHRVERWCNQVAAELLVPLGALQEALPRMDPLAEAQNLARRFKVSTLVILSRILDTGRISRNTFQEAYNQELGRLRRLPKFSGGDFYLTQGARLSKRFVRTLVASTLEGQTSFTEAFRLLGVKKMATFRELGVSLGVGA